MDSLGECIVIAEPWNGYIVTYASPCLAMQDPSSIRWANRNVCFGGCIDALYLFWISLGIVTRYSMFGI